MLLNLHVKNLAIIDEVEVYFKDNLNILTGETGAGKSIIIGSVNIALGAKVSKEMIRKGADYAMVELVFQLEDKGSLEAIKALELPVEENQIIISRKIMNGRSVSKVNGENVTASVLKEIAGILIDIHGQHEHQSLLYKKKHLDILDRYSREEIGTLKEETAKAYREYFQIKQQIETSDIDEDKRLREISFLEYEVNEIDSAKLEVLEDAELALKHKKLANASMIGEGLGSIYQLTGSEDLESFGEVIGRAEKILHKLVEYDGELSGLNSQLADIGALMNDFNRDLSDYISSLELDEEGLLQVEQRLNLINNLKAKYGNSIEAIQEYYNKSLEKLNKYKDFDNYTIGLKQKLEEKEKLLEKLSRKLSQIRRNKGSELAEKIKAALIDLNFMDVRFEMDFNRMDHFTASGYDEGEFIISTNPGEDLKPLAKVASGGELSRIMLAIKSVLADNDSIETLIFDEIDVGISGRTAQKVSEKLSMIARNHQVLCITHLPQIAAMADCHYVIEKTSDGSSTSTAIYELGEDAAIHELARMLGGAKITDTVINSAKEMKELASHTKNC